MVDLDAQRLELFAQRLRQFGRMRVHHDDVWRAFAAAFPVRPQGSDERRILTDALAALAARGILRLPAAKGRAWDGAHSVRLPLFVELVIEAKPNRVKSWRAFPWHPQLVWVADLLHLPNAHETFLRRVHEGLVNGAFADLMPLKYRSLQLTRDEKALGELAATKLFGPGRLSLEMLGCFQELLPVAWERVGEAPRAIVFENAGPFWVARSVLRRLRDAPYGVIVFGEGARFERSILYLSTLPVALERIDYVGDLDRDGLRTALAAARTAAAAGLPTVRPAPAIHHEMLRAASAFGKIEGWPHEGAREVTPSDAEFVEFLPADLRAAVIAILGRGNRIPEEALSERELTAIWTSQRR